MTTNTTNINIHGNYYPWDLKDKLSGGNLGLAAGMHYWNLTTLTEGFDIKNATGFLMFEAGAQYGRYFNDLPLRAELTAGIGNYRLATDYSASAFALNSNVATLIELGESNAYAIPFLGYSFESNKFSDPYFNQEKTNVNGLVLGASLVRP